MMIYVISLENPNMRHLHMDIQMVEQLLKSMPSVSHNYVTILYIHVNIFYIYWQFFGNTTCMWTCIMDEIDMEQLWLWKFVATPRIACLDICTWASNWFRSGNFTTKNEEIFNYIMFFTNIFPFCYVYCFSFLSKISHSKFWYFFPQKMHYIQNSFQL